LTLNCPPGEREFIGNLLLRRAEIAGRFVADDSMW
jgi:hypothetical protein